VEREIDPGTLTLDLTVEIQGPGVKRMNRFGLTEPDGPTAFI
jgi:hypothetical protein